MSIRHELALVAVLATAYLTACAGQAPAASDNREVEAAVEHFLAAFNNLDWPEFRACFADDASAFNPDIPEVTSTRRLDGRDAIERNFESVFAATKRQSSGRPYMHLAAQHLRVQRVQDIAVASFEIGRADGSIGRRTLVFEKRAGRWLIVHLHASNTSAR